MFDSIIAGCDVGFVIWCDASVLDLYSFSIPDKKVNNDSCCAHVAVVLVKLVTEANDKTVALLVVNRMLIR